MPTPIPEGLRLGAIEPQDAIAAFVRRGLLQPSFRWQDVWQEEHARAFTVAGVLQLDVLKAFQDEIDLSLREGRSLADFAQRIRPQLARAGFWGDVDVTDPKTGEQRTTTFNDARLRLIYDVNLRQSHAAGRWARIERNKASHPFVMYRTRHDERVRQTHKPWHGLVLPVADPFWKTHFPPNGWRCRCTAFAVSERDVQKYIAAGEPVKRSAPPAQTVDYVNPHTGQVLPVPRGIDPGFGYNPGRVHAQDGQQRLDERLAQIRKVAPAVADAVAASVKTGARLPTVPVDNAVVNRTQLQEFFENRPESPARVVVAVLTDEDRALFDTTAEFIWLSRVSLDEHLAKHPEVGLEDYLLIPELLRSGEVWAGPQDRRFALLKIAGKPYRAAWKVEQSGEEAWFLSLFISTKQKPPKGAVRIR